MARITGDDLPAAVRSHAQAVGAVHWLEALPETVAHLEAEWGMAVGRVLPGGSEALVAEVRLDDGTPAVLKLLLPTGGTVGGHEITALRLARGEGAALLLRADASRNAMLLERRGEPLGASSLTPVERRTELCAAATRFWRQVPDTSFPTGAEKGRWLIDFVRSTWAELGEPCSARAVSFAIACVERRIAAHDAGRAVLVHGDIHEWNALASKSGYSSSTLTACSPRRSTTSA
jgi:streptomycin 6-kinase